MECLGGLGAYFKDPLPGAAPAQLAHTRIGDEKAVEPTEWIIQVSSCGWM